MQTSGYSPYQSKDKKRGSGFKLPKLSGGIKKWLYIVLGVLVGIFVIVYLCLGDLRFFANNYFRLTFFSKQYLILLQNNYEIRPGGGFITGYGNLNTFMGFTTELSFHNSYDIDTDTYVMPPYPHEELLKNEWYAGYTFRDANWNPNFPESAPVLIDFYQKKFPDKDVDGIIVVNFSFIEDLVDEMSGIEIDGRKLNKNNLFSVITHTVNDIDRHNEEELSVRKDVLGDLAKVLAPKMKWHPFKTKKVLIEALNNKDLYFWFDSNGMQRKVIEKGWANAFTLPANSDFLAVNIANLGSKKADRYIQKEVYHYVNITKELPEITTEIVVRYPGFKSTYADDYKGYLQLVIPGEATIDETLLDSRVTIDGDFKVIGEKVILPAGSRTTLAYTYTLPRAALSIGEYNLRVIKQSGDDKIYFITVETVPDSLIESDDFETRENRAIFAGKLDNDRDFSLTLLPDEMPPYPIEQVFDNLDTISIYWNEPIDTSTGNDATNYQITDLNRISDVTDEVDVVYAEVIDASISKLEIAGVTKQYLERYQIELKNLRDNSGNEIDPNPKTITVVQRYEESSDEDSD